MVRYDDGDSGLGDEGRSLRRSDVEFANHPEQVKSVAIDDWAAVKAPSIVADRDLNPDAYTTDDMHKNMSTLASVVSVSIALDSNSSATRSAAISCVLGQKPSNLGSSWGLSGDRSPKSFRNAPTAIPRRRVSAERVLASGLG
jgi:hypothetical protein